MKIISLVSFIGLVFLSTTSVNAKAFSAPADIAEFLASTECGEMLLADQEFSAYSTVYNVNSVVVNEAERKNIAQGKDGTGTTTESWKTVVVTFSDRERGNIEDSFIKKCEQKTSYDPF